MNITKENTGDLTALIKIELTEADYKDQVTKVLKDYQRKANIPGFRPGKVPFGMINKMYAKPVMAEEINKKVSESLNQYIVDEKLEILGYPLPNTDKTEEIDFDSQKDFEFYFDIALTPEFEVKLNDKLKVNYYNIKADDDIVEKYMKDLQKRNGQVTNPEVAEETDVVKGSFVELDENDKVVEDGISNTAPIDIDTIKLKTEKKKFVGKKVGDVIKFNPMKATKSAVDTATMLGISTAQAEEIKTKFEFTITEITRTALAELNEEFFKMIYPQDEIKDVDGLKERIRKDAEGSFVAEADRQFMNSAVEALVDEAKIDLPDEFMKRWLLESNQGKVTAEQLEVQYDNYVKSLKWQLIEQVLIKDHQLEVKEEDVRNHIKSYFQNMSPEAQNEEADNRMNEIVNSIMQNQDEVKRVYDQLYDAKLSELFKANLKLVNKNISYEEFVKLATQIN